jgi:dolichol-phosphate mannosyltransferase
MDKVVIVIPTYNEAQNIADIVNALFALGIDALHVLIVDDNSPDGTGKIADQLVQDCPGKVSVIHREAKLGLGTAYITGFQWALQRGATHIIQMDADFSHSPSYLPQFLEWIKSYDVVVGSRYVSGGKLDENWGWGRWFLSWWANSVWVRLSLGTQTRDATAGFKCWRAGALQTIGLDKVRSNGYVFQVEMCYIAEKIGLRIKEIPIYFEDRHIGRSKMSMRIKIEAAMRVFQIRYRHRRLKKIPSQEQTLQQQHEHRSSPPYN